MDAKPKTCDIGVWKKHLFLDISSTNIDRAEAVCSWLPTAAARVRARIWSSGFCGGQTGAGTDLLRVLRFPLPIFIPLNSPFSQ
jgi:hypothetical protein